MENKCTMPTFPSEIIDSMKPFLENEENYYQIRTDVTDIYESVMWLSEFSKSDKWSSLDELETAMIEMDISFIDHIQYHIKSLKKNMKYALEKISEHEENSH